MESGYLYYDVINSIIAESRLVYLLKYIVHRGFVTTRTSVKREFVCNREMDNVSSFTID